MKKKHGKKRKREDETGRASDSSSYGIIATG